VRILIRAFVIDHSGSHCRVIWTSVGYPAQTR
jgi:hypothetical protein